MNKPELEEINILEMMYCCIEQDDTLSRWMKDIIKLGYACEIGSRRIYLAKRGLK